jgi:uncharacterized protein YqjF (DUF2071 family)
MSAIMQAEDKSRTNRWVIAQRWSHVQFLSARCDADLLRQSIPPGLELDQFDGAAWLSIVPFYMSHIRFPVTPALPIVCLWELNLRTYVRYRGCAGVYFLTLDTDSRLGDWIARRFFHLPYRYRQMTGRVNTGRYTFDAGGSFAMQSQVGRAVQSAALDDWLVERYHLYTSDGTSLYRGDVAHGPWRLRQVDALSFEDRLSPQFGFPAATELHARYAEPLDVRFKPFVKLPSN